MYDEGIHMGIKEGVSPDTSPEVDAEVPLPAFLEYSGDHPEDDADMVAIRCVSAAILRFNSTCFNCRSSPIRD